jgi:hypothetical protein
MGLVPIQPRMNADDILQQFTALPPLERIKVLNAVYRMVHPLPKEPLRRPKKTAEEFAARAVALRTPGSLDAILEENRGER